VTHRVAAIDCGTNSIRLLIADITPDAGGAAAARAPLADVTRQMRIVRLGEGVDRTGRLSPAALDRTMAALSEYAGLIAEARPEAVRMVATSATRDAANSQEFTDRVRAILGVAPEVISGDDEAWLSFTGATRELASTPLAAECLPPYLVTDIGGGSTEFVLGPDGATAAGQVPRGQVPRGQVPRGQVPRGQVPRGQMQGRSVNIGCVRMTERHLHGDPPLPAEIADTTRDIDAALELVGEAVPAEKARTLVGLAGSVTTVAAIALGLGEYDSARIHHSRISAARVHEIAGELLAMTRAERAALPVMHPGRVDVIGAGALILDRIVTRFGFAEVLVSEHDILDGIAWSAVP
jgi:exopolyphosphatase/guanosine-5'-triphosphate,3'-diphosphate pyrophosphatase